MPSFIDVIDIMAGRSVSFMNALIFGKFAPLHYGHIHLIQTALDHSGVEDRVYVLVSDNPEIAIASSIVRAQWIRESIVDGRLRVIPTGEFPPSGRSVEAQRANFVYMCQMLPEGVCIDRVYCNEWYGAHIARDFGAQWVQVDPQRCRYPISATQIRDDPRRHAEFLPPPVQQRYTVQRSEHEKMNDDKE